ncbi:hypothetical protein ACVRXQ_11705 [Streptococcus panodentis]|uniref:Lipoprotein n=1 Tax=Streptococcus panodentis TaxID=1581472 RepID=A0ABS5AZ48_9STRE|nr:hypothetical protein [Streptococcus panodentis]MBP2621852.1 hypothetical protein [Streptococcus panodentis]
MKKRTKAAIAIVLPILAFASLGGYIISQKRNHEEKTIISTSKKGNKEAIRQQQLAYLKEHEQEIIDFVKAQSPKIESVQIDWDQTQWSDGGLTNPEYYINVFGRINNIEESGWGVDIPINDDESVDLEEMIMGDYISIVGEPIA